MSNHRQTEHFFRRIEDTLATLFATNPPTTFGMAPRAGRTAAALCNDLSIGLKTFIRRRFASTKVRVEDAAAFDSGYVLRVDRQRNIVYVAPRTRLRDTAGHVTPLDAEQVLVTGDMGESQLAQRLDVLSPHGRRVALAVATLFNANYLNTPVSFVGHVDAEFEVELRSVYPDINVLNDTHPIYGNIVVII